MNLTIHPSNAIIIVTEKYTTGEKCLMFAAGKMEQLHSKLKSNMQKDVI